MNSFLIALICSGLAIQGGGQACNKAAEALSIETGVKHKVQLIENYAKNQASVVKNKIPKVIQFPAGLALDYTLKGKISYKLKSKVIKSILFTDNIQFEYGKDSQRIQANWSWRF